MSESERELWEGWALVELMGHRKLAGFVTRAEIAGTAMLRLDVPGPDGAPVATQYYGPGSVYCLTPTTEVIARGFASKNRPMPVTRWELPAPEKSEPKTEDVYYGRGP